MVFFVWIALHGICFRPRVIWRCCQASARYHVSLSFCRLLSDLALFRVHCRACTVFGHPLDVRRKKILTLPPRPTFSPLLLDLIDFTLMPFRVWNAHHPSFLHTSPDNQGRPFFPLSLSLSLSLSFGILTQVAPPPTHPYAVVRVDIFFLHKNVSCHFESPFSTSPWQIEEVTYSEIGSSLWRVAR